MTIKTIDVAVAVIHFHNQYLLGYRNAKQHQGNRYEFVGGKLEVNETPVQALIREVDEEIGIHLEDHACTEMGKITHHYAEKTVCLHIFDVQATQVQFDSLQAHNMPAVDTEVSAEISTLKGRLNQPLVWVDKAELLAGKYPLPDANTEILQWLEQR